MENKPKNGFAYLKVENPIDFDHKHVCAKRPPNYTQVDKKEFTNEWGDISQYQIVSKLGQGTYSEVLLGCSVSNNQPCVIKILKPASIDKHSREIKILQILYGGPNIVKMWDAIVRGKTVCLVFELVERGEEWKVFD